MSTLDIRLTVNGEAVAESGRAAHHAGRLPARDARADRQPCRLRARRVRRLHGAADGVIVRGCLTLAVQCDGAQVETIEGVSDSGDIADLQEAFRRRNALQCGFCTPAMLLTAQELLARGGVPSRDTIREHLAGNYCRCTGYQAIVDAIESVAQARAKR